MGIFMVPVRSLKQDNHFFMNSFFSPFPLFDSLLISLLVFNCMLDFTKVLMRCWSSEKNCYCNSFYGVNLH